MHYGIKTRIVQIFIGDIIFKDSWFTLHSTLHKCLSLFDSPATSLLTHLCNISVTEAPCLKPSLFSCCRFKYKQSSSGTSSPHLSIWVLKWLQGSVRPGKWALACTLWRLLSGWMLQKRTPLLPALCLARLLTWSCSNNQIHGHGCLQFLYNKFIPCLF